MQPHHDPHAPPAPNGQAAASDRLRDASLALADLLHTRHDLARRVAELESRCARLRTGFAAAANRAARAESYLDSFLRSRIYRAAWGLSLIARPDWVSHYNARPALPAPPPAPADPGQAAVTAELASLYGQLEALRRRLDEETAPNAGDGAAAGNAAQDEMSAFLHHLVQKGFRPRVILDVGSAKGYWSERTHWLHFPDAHYYMIDPLDESQDHLQELARRSPNFRPLQLAVGSQPGELAINVSPDGDGSSLLAVPPTSGVPRRTVPVDTLDRLLDAGRIAPPDLVKIDVQGFEIEALRGASKLFGLADVFIIEVNLFRFMPGCPLAHEVIAFMADRGYRLYDLAGSLRRPYQDDLGQLDLVFVADRSPLIASTRWK